MKKYLSFHLEIADIVNSDAPNNFIIIVDDTFIYAFRKCSFLETSMLANSRNLKNSYKVCLWYFSSIYTLQLQGFTFVYAKSFFELLPSFS